MVSACRRGEIDNKCTTGQVYYRFYNNTTTNRSNGVSALEFNGALSLSIICNSLRKRMLLLRTLPCFSELSIKLVY